jgi:predicted ATPase/class 3 adenylate cyclase
MVEFQDAPQGTIALLFTDIEGSTRLASKLGAAWGDVLANHHALLSKAIAAEDGFVSGTEGDAFFATFVDAAAAARAAVASLRVLRAHHWPDEVGGELGVRMGLHVGFVERQHTGYVGLEVHRAARVAAAAHGGQLLLTGAARALIGDAIPVEPLGSHRLKDFPSPEPLFCAVVDGRGASAFPPPMTQELRPTNLPAGLPALIGREDDLRRVRSALVDEGERLVTLTGRGGVGKTSLALVAAAELLDEHEAGVWLVSLATATSPDEVVPAVAAAIGADRDVTVSALEAVIARLFGRGRVLLILDNLERLVAAGPELLELLDALPDLHMLITSQAPLRLAAERCVPLDALDEAAALAVIERVAERRGAAVSARGPDRDTLLEVARLLDGLPLGLELAAARLGLLSPNQLLERLRASTDLLQDSAADRPDRQRSLRATVDWTLSLLDPSARELFVRMGVFAGSVELTDLEAVAGIDGLDVLETLARLIDVALARRIESGDGRVRFGLPEALRQISAEMLDGSADADRWRRSHARRQHDLAWSARTLFVPANVFRAATAADAEAAAALRWARDIADPVAVPLGAARAMLLANEGRFREALSVLEPVLKSPTNDRSATSIALVAYAVTLWALGRLDNAKTSADRAVESAADPETRALALSMRGVIQAYRGEFEADVRDSSEAAALMRDRDPAGYAGALLYEAQARMMAGELDRAQERLAEAESVGRPVDAKALWHLDTLFGDIAVMTGHLQEGCQHYARSLEAAEARGDQLQIHHDLSSLGQTLAMLGRDEDGLEVAGMAEAHAVEIGSVAESPGDHFHGDHLGPAAQRVGSALAEELKTRGRAVPAATRVTVACQRARSAEVSATRTPQSSPASN